MRTLRRWIWGYELWLAFLVSAVATGGSPFFSEVAHFVPCVLCWFIEARPLAFIGPDSERGRTAAIAAGEQDKLFNFTQSLYLNEGTENTGWLNDELVVSAAASIPGLDVSRFLAARSSAAVRADAGAYDRQAEAGNVRSTPTILVGKSAGALRPVALTSPTDEQSVESAITAALHS